MDFALARHNMVEGQIRTNRVTDQLVVNALDLLPREVFVPDALKTQAYIDEDLTVAPGRILMEPMVMARLLQAARIEDTDICLVVAASTGYEAAAISRLASAVIALESNEAQQQAAAINLAATGADTVSVLIGELAKGHPGQGPYDVIFINGGVGELPENLTDQMAEGGRLVCVRVAPSAGGKAVLVTKENGQISEAELFDANIPALAEFAAAPEFNF